MENALGLFQRATFPPPQPESRRFFSDFHGQNPVRLLLIKPVKTGGPTKTTTPDVFNSPAGLGSASVTGPFLPIPGPMTSAWA